MQGSATRTATAALLVRLGLTAVLVSLAIVAYALLDVAIRGLILLLAAVVVVFSYVIYEVICMGTRDRLNGRKAS